MGVEYNTKQQQILNKGRELFWKHGFKRVSIEEICREAEVSKMTFYKYFSNKNELIITILDEIFSQATLKIRQIGEDKLSPGAKLEKIMQVKFEGSMGISDEFIKDLYANPTGQVSEYIQKKTGELFHEVIMLYERGKKDGWVRKDLNIPFMIEFTRKSMDLISKEDIPPYFENAQEMIMELTRLFVYGIAPHD